MSNMEEYFERKERCLRVVNLMYRQIFASVSKFEYLSWGVSDRAGLYYLNMPTLSLTVNGALHKGKVYVSLNEGADLYEIRLLNKEREVVNCITDIYCDQLGRAIDGLVERPQGCTDEEYMKLISLQG